MKKLTFVFGTRPEAIKLAPLIIETRNYPDDFQVKVCFTGQHKEMVAPILAGFDIVPDYNLDIMQPNQTLAQITSRAMVALDELFHRERPDIVIVQGDTTTVFAASLAAFYHKIPVAHVEAGLRTFNKYSPWPEEVNRSLVGRIARWHFAPTQQNADNLVAEGISEKEVFITGNTVIDALLLGIKKIDEQPALIRNMYEGVKQLIAQHSRYVLITGHRRENFGAGFEQICLAIQTLAERFPGVAFVYPVHLNPNVQEPVKRLLTGKSNIHLIAPMDYFCFLQAMKYSTLILTDSGGVQEEAPSLGKPVLVMRDNTERSEAVKAGLVELVGTRKKDIVDMASLFLNGSKSVKAAQNPYGDGLASQKILTRLAGHV